MGKGSVVPSTEGDARHWFDVVWRALRTLEGMMILSPCRQTVTLVVGKTDPITLLFIS